MWCAGAGELATPAPLRYAGCIAGEGGASTRRPRPGECGRAGTLAALRQLHRRSWRQRDGRAFGLGAGCGWCSPVVGQRAEVRSGSVRGLAADGIDNALKPAPACPSAANSVLNPASRGSPPARPGGEPSLEGLSPPSPTEERSNGVEAPQVAVGRRGRPRDPAVARWVNGCRRLLATPAPLRYASCFALGVAPVTLALRTLPAAAPRLVALPRDVGGRAKYGRARDDCCAIPPGPQVEQQE